MSPVPGRPSSKVRWLVLASWLAAGLLLLPRAARVEDGLDVSARILGSESARVEQVLAERFESPFAQNAVVVIRGVPSPETPEGESALLLVVDALAGLPGVTGTFSHLDQPDPFLVGRDGRDTFLVVGLEAPGGRVDRLLPGLRGATAPLQARLREAWPDATMRWTGEAAINYDVWRTSADEAQAAEFRALPLTLLLLVVAFGSLVAATLPAAAGALSVGLTMGLVAMASRVWPLSILVVNVASMLGLALGIDYALLIVTRFREARLEGSSPSAAARVAARRAGRTVALSGTAVAIGFLALLLVPLRELRSAALGGLLVVIVSVLVAITLLPTLLAWLGPHLESGRLWRSRPDTSAGWWRRWAGVICRRPGSRPPSRGGADAGPGIAGGASRSGHPGRTLASPAHRGRPGPRGPPRHGTGRGGPDLPRRAPPAGDDHRPRGPGLGGPASSRLLAARRAPGGPGAVAADGGGRPGRRPRLRVASPVDGEEVLPGRPRGGGARGGGAPGGREPVGALRAGPHAAGRRRDDSDRPPGLSPRGRGAFRPSTPTTRMRSPVAASPSWPSWSWPRSSRSSPPSARSWCR